MRRNIKTIIVIILVIVALIGTRYIRAELAHLRDLEQHRVQQMNNWIIMQASTSASLNRVVTEVLVVSKPDSLAANLGKAADQARHSRETLWESYAMPYELYRELEIWNYRHSYNQAAEYLRYLAEQSPVLLSPIEIENLQLIRQLTETINGGLSNLKSQIEYRSGTSLHYHSWRSIAKNKHTVTVLNNFGQAVRSLPEVGANDPSFAAYKEWLQQWYITRISEGLAYSNERLHSEVEMLNLAKEFMGRYTTGLLKSGYTYPGADMNNPQTWSSGGGSGGSSGSFTTFILKEDGASRHYEISVSQIGGHIYGIRMTENTTSKSSLDELVQHAEMLLAHWEESENITLQLNLTYQRDSEIWLLYAPVVDGVILGDQCLTVSVYHGEQHREAINIGAHSFFDRYGREIDTKPSLTAADVLKEVSPHLQLAGEPRLEYNGSKLLYRIPVEGIAGLNAVYVDANTGQYEYIDYEYQILR